MIIAKNDEVKRSKIWRIVMIVSSVLIIIIGIFLLTKLFTNNPLEGSWKDEEGRVNLQVKGSGVLTAEVLELGEGANAEVEMRYTIDKEQKTISITSDEAKVQEVLENADGQYEEEELKNVLETLNTTFDYSVDREELTLSEREYGEQMIFTRQ